MNASIDHASVGEEEPRSLWRILLVEDSPDDGELTCITLADAAMDVDCRRVDTEVDLLQALVSFVPHLVLSDMNLPGFSGEHAIELVREHAPGARFIFLSGASNGGDPAWKGEPAADAWLSKEDLAQLPALVRKLLGP